jgi:hypothetical protein
MLVGQAFVNSRHTGKGRITAILRSDFAAQDGAHGRAFSKGFIGMPDVSRCRWIAFLVVVDDQLGHLVDTDGKGMHDQVTEITAETYQVIGRYLLVGGAAQSPENLSID